MDILTIHGVRGFIDGNGMAQLSLEDVSRGLGFTTVATSGNEVVRWSRVHGYLNEIGFSQQVEKDGFIPENVFYRLAMKARNEAAEAFQAKVADEILPSIRKTGGYVANENAFIETYLPFVDDQTRAMFKQTLAVVRQQNEVIKSQREEIEYKEKVIVGLVDDIDLAAKRQILNRVVRRGGKKYQERWRELYKQFEMKYHINLSARLDRYNENNKPKLKNKIEYIDKVMGKIPELYEIAAKLYENDVKELAEELYELNAR
ncbi:transporter [Paenibacillus polymyxa]|uniref:transporter n=1 Tax=Paenibacillus polymyxa TaxID=1406 RepID=UPI000DD8803E|nr:transporter [Paenibacillus polymyxa]